MSILTAMALAAAITTADEPCVNPHPLPAVATGRSRPARLVAPAAPAIRASGTASTSTRPRVLRRLPASEYPCGDVEDVPPLSAMTPTMLDLDRADDAPMASTAPDGWLIGLPEVGSGSVLVDSESPATCDCFAGWPSGGGGGGGGWYPSGGGSGGPPIITSPVPEPSVIAQLVAGILAFLGAMRLRRTRCRTGAP